MHATINLAPLAHWNDLPALLGALGFTTPKHPEVNQRVSSASNVTYRIWVQGDRIWLLDYDHMTDAEFDMFPCA